MKELSNQKELSNLKKKSDGFGEKVVVSRCFKEIQRGRENKLILCSHHRVEL